MQESSENVTSQSLLCFHNVCDMYHSETTHLAAWILGTPGQHCIMLSIPVFLTLYSTFSAV